MLFCPSKDVLAAGVVLALVDVPVVLELAGAGVPKLAVLLEAWEDLIPPTEGAFPPANMVLKEPTVLAGSDCIR